MYEVTMVKGTTGVGLSLEGGKGSPRGDMPILIKRIFKGERLWEVSLVGLSVRCLVCLLSVPLSVVSLLLCVCLCVD